jgi:hypothetical protein
VSKTLKQVYWEFAPDQSPTLLTGAAARLGYSVQTPSAPTVSFSQDNLMHSRMKAFSLLFEPETLRAYVY